MAGEVRYWVVKSFLNHKHEQYHVQAADASDAIDRASMAHGHHVFATYDGGCGLRWGAFRSAQNAQRAFAEAVYALILVWSDVETSRIYADLRTGEYHEKNTNSSCAKPVVSGNASDPG